MKKTFAKILGLAFAASLGLTQIAYALEVDFPEFGGIKPSDSFGPIQWIHYIFQFGLAAVGIALIYSFSRAGLEWMFADTITNKQDAIERIKSAVAGFVLLLGSYVVLNTINPNLVNLQNQTVDITIKEAGNPNGNGAVGECNDYWECGSDEVCIDKITGRETSNNLLDKSSDASAPKKGVCQSTSSSASDQGGCGNGIICQTPGFRCLDNNTGDVITNPGKTDSPAGTCTKKRTWMEVCSSSGAYDTGCFKGRCLNNVCTP